MNPASYNPAALELMRRNAALGLATLAHMLCWPEDRVVRTANWHRIDIGGVGPEIVSSPPLAPLPNIRPRLTATLPPAKSSADPTARRSREMCVDAQALNEIQAQIYELLIDHPRGIRGVDLAKELNRSGGAISKNMDVVRAKLAEFGVTIEAAKGPQSDGYRLSIAKGRSFPTLTASREFVLPSAAEDDSTPVNPRSPRNPQGEK